jgi:hypothetical protein
MNALARLAFAAAAALLGGLGGAATASAAGLAGTTTLSASASGYAPVHLDAPVNVQLCCDEKQDARVTVTGTGKVVGFMLRRDEDSGDAPGLLGYRMDIWGYEGDDLWMEPIGRTETTDGEESWAATLPAGDYRLYVLADNSPVKVTLTIPGLGGTLDLTPAVTVPQKMGDLARHDSLPTTNAAVVGDVGTLSSRGLTLGSVFAFGDASAVQRFEFCTYGPGQDATGSDAFDRGCPGGDGDEYTSIPEFFPSPPFFFFPGGWGYEWQQVGAPAGAYGYGANVQTVGAPPELQGQAAWIAFDGPGSAPAGQTTVPVTAPSVTPPVAAPPAKAAKPAAKKKKACRKKKAAKGKRAKAKRCKKPRKRHKKH